VVAREALRTAGVVLVVAAVAIFVLIGHVLHGGFYSDDWANAADYTFSSRPHYWSSVSEFGQLLGGRPVGTLLIPAPYALFGVRPEAHLALMLGLSVLAALLFYGLLRVLALGAIEATMIAVLALTFPWSDSTKLWAGAVTNNVATIFFLSGALVAVGTLSVAGRRGHAWHALAVVLYVLSVLTYEAAAAAALLVGLFYLGRGPRRKVAAYWAVDVFCVVGALAYEWVAIAPTGSVPSLDAKLDAIPDFVHELSWLLARSSLPGVATKWERDVVLGGITLVVAAALWRRNGDPRLTRWLRVAAVGGLTLIAAYAAMVGSGLTPLSQGLGNRANILAGLGFAAIAYSVIKLAALLAFPSRQAVAATASGLAAICLTGWYAHHFRWDAARWNDAAGRQAQILDSLRRALPSPRSGTTIFLFGAPAETAPGVPVFDRYWDFNGAVRLTYGDGSLRGFPAPPGGLRCTTSGVPRPLGKVFDRPDTARYGTIVAFDAASRRVTTVRSVAACKAADSRFASNA
jgi:hypothetical protein